MCGIVGFIGKNKRDKAANVLLDGLAKLEYRGYDSAGIAVLGDGKIRVEKSVGRLAALRDKLKGKMVGGLFNRREYEINGRNGWYTQCKRFVSVEAVKTENYKLPDDESLAGRSGVVRPSADSFMTVDSVDDEDLPFA